MAGATNDVIKVPEGAVLSGCKTTRRKLREHLQLRVEVRSQLRVIASLFEEEELDKLSAARPAGWKPPAGQRIGESRWRPLDLCYERLRDKPPKAQEQQQPAVAQ
ncbi:hypothetical protein HaLaN_05716 [Haematococcus lacustris]|uniref:Uncharacterized protein n=1 Tax=Haematococcus lacustris TaxID=44745 RepID=A0A699YVA9_HAELA|nr:hypothetical protein HaLaN_05716 [Haematococcus lacustris]